MLACVQGLSSSIRSLILVYITTHIINIIGGIKASFCLSSSQESVSDAALLFFWTDRGYLLQTISALWFFLWFLLLVQLKCHFLVWLVKFVLLAYSVWLLNRTIFVYALIHVAGFHLCGCVFLFIYFMFAWWFIQQKYLLKIRTVLFFLLVIICIMLYVQF